MCTERPMYWAPYVSSTLSWLVDAAADSAGADRFLAELGAHLLADGLPLAGGSLTLDIPHPVIARRTWLWRVESGEVIEALGFNRHRPRRQFGQQAGGVVTAERMRSKRDQRRRRLGGKRAGHKDLTLPTAYWASSSQPRPG